VGGGGGGVGLDQSLRNASGKSVHVIYVCILSITTRSLIMWPIVALESHDSFFLGIISQKSEDS